MAHFYDLVRLRLGSKGLHQLGVVFPLSSLIGLTLLSFLHAQVSDISRNGSRRSALKDLLPNSSDEEDHHRVIVSESDSDNNLDFALDYNQNDFDMGTTHGKVSRKAQEVENPEMEIDSWPPKTYSGSGAVFCVTPMLHAKYDPKFCYKWRNTAQNVQKAVEVLDEFGSAHGGFEACFTGEPPLNIEYRKDAYQNAWDLCLMRCKKVLQAHFSVALHAVCLYIRSKHESRLWNMNMLPTAVLTLGVDSSDHPILFGVLQSRLKRRSRSVAFLRPSVCTTMSKLMRSLLQQIVPDIRSSSEQSFVSIQRYAETVENFALTIVVENVEQWSNSDLLGIFLSIASQYSVELNMTLILAASSTKESVFNILPAIVLQHLTIRSFQVCASTTAIDLILRNTMLAPDAPFQLSSAVLKWILETVKFLDYSVSSLVTKLKFIYWLFYYTHPMSWIAGTTMDAESFVKDGVPSDELMAPIGRIVHRFFVEYPYMQYEDSGKAYLAWFREKVVTVSRPSRSCREPSKEPISVAGALRQWKSKYRRLVAFRSLALQLFMVVRHLPVLLRSSPSSSSTGWIHLPEESIKFIDAIKREEDDRLATAAGTNGGKNLGHVNGLFDASVMERHDWYGCPHTIEYYALITNPRPVINWAFEPYRNDNTQLKVLFDVWMSIINEERTSSSRPALCNTLNSIFAEARAGFELADQALKAKAEEASNPQKPRKKAKITKTASQSSEIPQSSQEEGTIESAETIVRDAFAKSAINIDKFHQNLIKRMKEVILGAFEEDASAHTPLSLDLTFADVAVLNRRFNPNIRPSQTNQVLDMVSELHEVKKKKTPVEKRQAGRARGTSSGKT